MNEKIESTESKSLSPIEQIRAELTEKNQRIAALEAALPRVGAGLIAEAVLFYLVALNAEYLAMCNALATVASAAQGAGQFVGDTEGCAEAASA